MKWIQILGLSLFLVGCQEVMEYEEEQEVTEVSLDSELTYIEFLIGMEELGEARLALDDLLLSLDGEVNDALQQSRINTMLMLLEGVNPELVIHDSHDFTGSDAVIMAMEQYDVDDDIVFMYHNEPSHFGDDQLGYYVVLKSLSLMESDQNSDSIILTLFVSDDGKIEEIE